MPLNKVKTIWVLSLKIAAIGIIATIFIYLCMPAKKWEPKPQTVAKVQNNTESNPVKNKSKKVHKKAKSKQKMIALTFDDGPMRPNTTSILKTLKKYNARATFFVVGREIRDQKDVLI